MARVAGSVLAAALAVMAAPGFARAQSPYHGRVLAQATVSPQAAYPAAPAGAAPANQVAAADLNGYTPAPVPDSDEAPLPSGGSAEAGWSPALFRAGSTYRGEGFTPGSSVQDSQNRNAHPAAGVALNVPLQ